VTALKPHTGQPHARSHLEPVLALVASHTEDLSTVTEDIFDFADAPTVFARGAGKAICVRSMTPTALRGDLLAGCRSAALLLRDAPYSSAPRVSMSVAVHECLMSSARSPSGARGRPGPARHDCSARRFGHAIGLSRRRANSSHLSLSCPRY